MRGVAEVATGAGKTVFAVLAVQLYLTRFPNGVVIVVVPTIALQEQWFVELTDQFSVDARNIGLVGGGISPTKQAKDRRIIIGVANSLRRQTLNMGSNVLLVADECHRLGSKQNARVLGLPHNASLGLSATPERDYDDGFLAFIKPYLGPIFFRYDYVSALKDGILAPFSLTNIEVPLLADEASRYRNLTGRIARALNHQRGASGQSAQLRRLLITRARIAAMAKSRIPVTVRLAMSAKGQCIVFHEDIRSADIIASNLRKRGIFAVAYHSKLSKALRLDNLRLFRRGDAKVLVCCRALDEGLNVPNAATGIISSSTASTRQRIQRLGRVLRASNSKGSAEVITLYATPSEKDRLEKEEATLASVARVRWQISRIERDND